ncbi:MAG: DUF362 domain-containing protein, partial [bacterium]|nr:DUF362 domain-containing protein [bacterium]
MRCRSKEPGSGSRSAGIGALVIGLVSLGWLLLRSGTKPSRLTYPCQQAAITGTQFLLPGMMLLGLHSVAKMIKRLFPCGYRSAWVGGIVLLIVVGGGGALFSWRLNPEPMPGFTEGYTTSESGVRNTSSLKQAQIIPSPHRVVAVHHAEATSWDFSCTSSGACGSYYGDDAFVDQVSVDAMVEEGLKQLTGEGSVSGAWQVLLPNYVNGETVLFKLNFNDSIMGGGVSGYGDNDAYVDALPQIVNSLVSGLLSFGVAESDIWLFDGSRYITDRFRSRLHYSELGCFDRYGNGVDVQPTTFAEIQEVDFSSSGYGGTHYIADPVVLADYVVNMPTMKRHGGAGITLALKNHLGSVNGFVSGSHSMHDFFYLSGGSYSPTVNP